VTVEEGAAAAAVCALNALAVLEAALGSLDRVSRILTVTGFVASAPELPPAAGGGRRGQAGSWPMSSARPAATLRSAIGVAALRGAGRSRSRSSRRSRTEPAARPRLSSAGAGRARRSAGAGGPVRDGGGVHRGGRVATFTGSPHLLKTTWPDSVPPLWVPLPTKRTGSGVPWDRMERVAEPLPPDDERLVVVPWTTTVDRLPTFGPARGGERRVDRRDLGDGGRKRHRVADGGVVFLGRGESDPPAGVLGGQRARHAHCSRPGR